MKNNNFALASMLLMCCFPASRTLASELARPEPMIQVGAGKTECDHSREVRLLGAVPRAVKVAAGQNKTAIMPSLTHEILWTCGNSQERTRNGRPFSQVQLERKITGEMEWKFYAAAQTAKKDHHPTRVNPIAHAGEIMTDRCSSMVAIPITGYDANPASHGAVVLQRDSAGNHAWSPEFTVKTDPDGHIRWWCDSTTGNWADPGTWRLQVTDGSGILGCLVQAGVAAAETSGVGAVSALTCLKYVSIGSSAFNGWTPERSRCGDHSTRISARLGPDRLLQIACLGH